jgi:thioredoxin reductase (NADPH)
MSVRDVLIVGAGPSGLATAIAAKQHGLDYVIVEKGMLVNSIFNFPTHMIFFTTPELLEIGGLPLVTPYDKPTRLEALRYYRRVVDTYQIAISFHEEVTSIEKESDGTFIVETKDGRGNARVRQARAVVLAIGYYDRPNYLGVPGEHLPHVNHYYTDAHPYYRGRVVVVGGKNSAAEACLELFRAGVHVTLVHRHATLHDQVLGAARYREPHQGRFSRRALQRVRHRDHAHHRRHQSARHARGTASRCRLPADRLSP